MPEEYRHTEPVQVPDTIAPARPDQPAAPLPPERTWNDNPLLWIVVVVAVFMAVPFLAHWSTRTPTVATARPAQAASVPPAAPEPAAEAAVPQRAAPAAVVPDRPAPVPARALPDPARQVVTKCVERGRVVYTQTGECAGSVSAVPIDASKNVVGPGVAASR